MEKEEIKKLLERFMEAKKASEATEDIWYGEQFLGEHPGPEPDEELIRNVKAAIRLRLGQEQRKMSRFQIVLKAASVAAVLAILSFAGTLLLNQTTPDPIQVATPSIAEVLWESDDIYAGDNKLTALDTEIQQIQGELRTLERGGTERNGASELYDIETELIVFAGDFWER
ncbi:MAG: hypothetical protein ACYSUK_02035 [Planctomycetota bacterium]|jgi:hypothetical protein